VLARLADQAVERLAAGQLVQLIPRVADGRLDALLPSVLRVRRGAAQPSDDRGARATVAPAVARSGACANASGVADPSALAGRMRQHALEWTELVGDELRFTREGAAREARLQITADGDSVLAVAERAEVSVFDRRLLVGDAPAMDGVSFAAAAVGDLVGPWEEDGQWHVLRLRAKVPPAPEGQAPRERATGELLAERIDRYTAGRVRVRRDGGARR
jgi:hypothetical protein